VANRDFLKCTDEISGETKFFEGTVQVNTVADFGTSVNATNNYGKIRSINQFLAKMPAGDLSENYKKQLMAQVAFFALTAISIWYSYMVASRSCSNHWTRLVRRLRMRLLFPRVRVRLLALRKL
jgi:hypothetical protein